MKPKKIFIWENESIVALDLRMILERTPEYESRVLKPSEDISLLISDEKPELFILSADMFFKVSEKAISIIKNLNIPLIIMSAGNNESLANTQFFSKNIYKVIEKPFDETDLIACMHRCLNQRAVLSN